MGTYELPTEFDWSMVHLDLAVRDSALRYPYRLFDGLLRKIRLSLHVGLSVVDSDLIISADKKTKRYKWVYPK